MSEVMKAIAARKAIYQAKLDQAMEASSLGNDYTREDLFRHAVEALEHLETDISNLAHLPTDLSEERARTIFDTAMRDARQDVGAWIREPAIAAMHQYAAGLQGEIAALRTQRNEVIEECARVAAGYYMKSGRDSDVPACRDIATAIRNLKSKDEPR